MVTNTIIQRKLNKVDGKVKAPEIERYVEKKTSRATAIKTAEEQKISLNEPTNKFCEAVLAAYALADAGTLRYLKRENAASKMGS